MRLSISAFVSFLQKTSSISLLKRPESSPSPALGATVSIRQSRSRVLSSPSSVAGSFPSPQSSVKSPIAASVLRLTVQSRSCAVRRLPVSPIAEYTASASMTSAPEHWSRSESASRIPPSASPAISSAALRSSLRPSHFATCSRWSAMTPASSRLKLWRWQRESIVAGTLLSSVVARMKTRCSGGSSRILSRALKAGVESMCTSSMIYTRFLTETGENTASSRS